MARLHLWVLGTLAVGVGGGLLVAGAAEADEAPLDGAPPSITGTAIHGHYLKAIRGTWSGQKPIA